MEEKSELIEPYATGMLDVGDGQSVYWEASGNPDGKPALALHGGPGSGSSPFRRSRFDPAVYRLIQFDQRGCGLSTPSVADPATDLSTNTTHHLIADIERLREHMGIDRWLVWGGSWGVTLGLAYAQQLPERVSEMILMSITMTRRRDVHWLAHDAGRFFPEEWARFSAGGGNADDLVAAYDRLLNDPRVDLASREKAARDWCDWEDALLSLEEDWEPWDRFDDPAFRMLFARMVTHYFSHAAWLEDDQLLRDAHRLTGIPGVLIHGRLDISGPPDVAWQLAQAWPDAELHLVRSGHTGSADSSRITADALARFATRD